MISLNKHPANSPFRDPYERTRRPIAQDPDLLARSGIRSMFPQGFKTDPYADDPAAQVFNSTGGSVAGLGGLGSAALGTVEDVVATVTQGNLWLTLALGGVLGVLLWPKAKKLLKG